MNKEEIEPEGMTMMEKEQRGDGDDGGNEGNKENRRGGQNEDGEGNKRGGGNENIQGDGKSIRNNDRDCMNEIDQTPVKVYFYDSFVVLNWSLSIMCC